MGEPFFSIVVPTYNRAGFILKAVQSVLSQDYRSFELIVVDDGSTDNTEEVLSAIADPRLLYFKKVNEERGAARNFGVRHARGVYVNFLDSDDVALAHHLSTAFRFIEKNNQPAIFHLAYDIRNVQGEVVRTPVRVTNVGKQILSGNLLSTNGVFVQREIILAQPFEEDRALASLEDWELWLRMCARYSFLHLNVVTSTLIQHDNRSMVSINADGIKKRVESFLDHVLTNEQNKAYYGNRLNATMASARTLVALHLAIAGESSRDVLKYFLAGIRSFPREVLKKRTLVIMSYLLKVRK